MRVQACYRDRIGRVRTYTYLASACARLPIHAIYGAIDDYTYVSQRNHDLYLLNFRTCSPAECKADVIANAAQGRFASVRKVEGAGHLVSLFRVYDYSCHTTNCLPK